MLSAVIITLNEETNILRCLEGLRGLADEVVVADSGSLDATMVLASQAGARVIQTPWLGYGPTRNWAAAQAKSDWILAIDADEVPDNGLRTAILSEKAHRFNRADCYQLSRVTQYCGHWVRHGAWYPDRIHRLYNRNQYHWEGAFVHEELRDKSGGHPSTAPLLSGELLHYSYPTIESHRRQIEKYSTLAAEAKHAKGKLAGPFRPYLSAGAAWLSGYILRGGFLDGPAGWHIARLTAKERWLRYRKLRGINDGHKK